MCLGIPGQIIAITDPEQMLATAEVGGIRREVNLACVTQEDPQKLVGRWVLIHVGFAMSLIDQQQAMETLQALEEVQALMREMDDFSRLRQSGAAQPEAGGQ